MKKYIKFASVLFAACAVFTACQKGTEGFSPLGPDQPDYSNAIEGTTLKMDSEMEQNDEFALTTLKVNKNDLLTALGVKTLPEDLVFYGQDKSGKNLYGSRYYTSTSGFYFDKNGYTCSSADKDARVFVDFTMSSLTLSIGQVPEVCEADDVYTLHAGLATTEAYFPLTITITITEAGAWATFIEHEDGLTFTVYETVKTDYTSLPVYLNKTAICEALGLSSISKLSEGLEDSSIKYYGLNANGSVYTDGNTANGYGHWFANTGDVCTWKATGWFCYSEFSSDGPCFNIGQATEGVEAGMTTTIRQKFVKGSKEAVLTFHVCIVNKVGQGTGT